MMMEREVTDSEGVFSRRLSGNWAELPQTLRKKQKHRPELLSQFTDMSESECEYRRVDSSIGYYQINNNGQPGNKRVVKRSEFLRRLENRNLLQLQHQPLPPEQIPPQQIPPQQMQPQLQQQFRRSMPDYRLRYEALDFRRRSLANLDNGNINFGEKYNAKMHFSDDERKTNSPDSLLVRSSESESSISDEYGHTDDSGAFLEKASSFDNNKRSSPKRFESEPPQQQQQSIPLRHRFAKFFTKQTSDDHKSTNGKSAEPSKLDVNKNNVQPIKPVKKENLSHRFEYENIPRIDIARLEQRSQSSCGFWKSNNRDALSPVQQNHQPTIEQLRLEEGCQLRNRKNSANSMFSSDQPKSSDELRLEGLIKDYYSGEEAKSGVAERKLSKMETIREEKDGSKLSVREILKRFEELRSPNESQLIDERSSDRTLTTIQETLQKLDEKVKSYQVMALIFFLDLL